MKTLTINPVTRIEGHAKISIHLNDDGSVADTQFHVTQLRGFEKFSEGRPFYEMPAITSRICGICPISHSLAAAKACDAVMAVRIPPAAAKLREILHLGQIVQSHALSFFHLSAPDLLLGMDSDPSRRNIQGLIEDHPDLARDGIALRKFGQTVIELLGKERIHPSWAAPGGVNAPLPSEHRDQILRELPAAKAIAERTLTFLKGELDKFEAEVASFGTQPTLYAGLVDATGSLQFYDGNLRFRDAEGMTVADGVSEDCYSEFVGESVLSYSYMKAPYYRPEGVDTGVYRVGPLARLNVTDQFCTPLADEEFSEFKQRCGRPAHSSFHFHYARLIEAIHALEKMERLLGESDILSKHVRAEAGVNASEGVGMIEAPRGILIHHYQVDEKGLMLSANLIVATCHNTLAMNRAIEQVAKRFVDGNNLQEGMLNRIQAVVRAYDPCLSCATHATGQPRVQIQLLNSAGAVLDTLCTAPSTPLT